MHDAQHPLTLSVLDRLLSPEDGEDEAALSEGALLARWKAGLHRDLAALLNARRRLASLPSSRFYQELASSSLNFGVPGQTAGALNDPQARQALCEELQRCIIMFEPRLKQVRVSLRSEASPGSQLALQIDAVLAEAGQEPVRFNTVVNSATGDVIITGDRE
jgi:type VI secretion system protein ImpF